MIYNYIVHRNLIKTRRNFNLFFDCIVHKNLIKNVINKFKKFSDTYCPPQ